MVILPTKSLAISYNHQAKQIPFFAYRINDDKSLPLIHGYPVTSMFFGVMLRGYRVGRNNHSHQIQTHNGMEAVSHSPVNPESIKLPNEKQSGLMLGGVGLKTVDNPKPSCPKELFADLFIHEGEGFTMNSKIRAVLS